MNGWPALLLILLCIPLQTRVVPSDYLELNATIAGAKSYEWHSFFYCAKAKPDYSVVVCNIEEYGIFGIKSEVTMKSGEKLIRYFFFESDENGIKEIKLNGLSRIRKNND